MMLDRRWRDGSRWLRRVQVSADPHMKAFTLKFQLGQRVVGNQPDQLAQLVHVDGRFEVPGNGRPMPPPTAVAMALGPRLGRLFA